MAKDPYAERLAALYAVPDEIVKQNLDVLKAQHEAVPTPSQEEVDDAVMGHPKFHAERLKARRAAAKAPVEEKAASAEEPAAHYKTRTVTPHTK
jgi:hypothetical protein